MVLIEVMALYNDYVTTEPFFKAVADIRIQQIGSHIRGIRRVKSFLKEKHTEEHSLILMHGKEM